LTGGKFAAAPAVSTLKFAGAACSTQAVAANALCVVTRSTDRSTIKVAVTTAAAYTLGLGAFDYTPAAGDIDAVNTTLGTAGGKVSASIGFTSANPSAIEASDTQATLDTPLASGDLLVAVQAITPSVAATSSTTKIDLTLTPAASDYAATAGTAVGRVTLGSFKFTSLSSNLPKQRADVTKNYLVTAGSADTTNTGVSVVLTPTAGQSFPVGAVLSLNSAVDCLVGTDDANDVPVTITSANASTAKTITTTTAIINNSDVFVCMTKPSTGNTAAPIQVSIAATVAAGSTNDKIATTSGNGYNLTFNGASVDVSSYWPGGLAPLGYNGYVRVTNTGSVAAAVTAQHINPATGALSGTSAVIVTSLAAGQSVVLSTATIDATVGAAPSGLGVGRLRITAPTNALRVQSLLQVGSNSPIEYSQAGQ